MAAYETEVDVAVRLSVLIATVPERRSLLSRMLHSLDQPGLDDTFEVIVHQGTRPHGEKVNRMVQHARGSHVAILDDDDWVAADYIAAVSPFTEDFVGYRIVVMVNGRYDSTVSHSAEYEGWVGSERGVSQKCPILREYALELPYPDDYYQDGAWSAEIQTHVRSGGFVDRDLYFYDYQTTDRYRSVGRWPFPIEKFRWL